MMDVAYWVLGPEVYVDLTLLDPLCRALETTTDSVTELCAALGANAARARTGGAGCLV